MGELSEETLSALRRLRAVESFLSKPPPRLGPADASWRVGDRAEQEAARLAAFRRGFEYGLADRE